MAQLKLYNSLTREKQGFTPLDEKNVRLYACGPTVYNYAHIGNARMAVVFDLLADVLRALYPKVTYVSNITDIEDKIIKAAEEQGKPISEITQKYAKIYNNDMAALGVKAPDIQPLATEHISEMIAQIEALIKRGHAYEADGHVLFNVPSYDSYGKFSGRNRDEQVAGSRVEVAPYKKDPADFVLWKPSTGDQPGWDSPWGYGRPGWHIECSAMAEKHLGLPFDIHGGGADLKFPHHENEIAQSCCAHGTGDDMSSFAKYWVHNGFVTVEGEKMAKSVGNVTLVHDLIDKYDGEILRLTLLSAQYRQPLDWTESALEQSRNYLSSIYQILHNAKSIAVTEKRDETVLEALCNDLNTPDAMGEIRNLSKGLDRALRDKDFEMAADFKSRLLFAGGLLGILQHDPAEWLGYTSDSSDEVDSLLAERQAAKAEKNFARADEIRDQLLEMGFTIEDTPEGPKLRKAG